MMELFDSSTVSHVRRGAWFAALTLALAAPAASTAQPDSDASADAATGPAPDGEATLTDRAGAATFKVENQLDQGDVDRSAAADKKRDESIELLKKLIPQAPEDRKAEMIFRLAELYWEKSRANYRNEMEEYEQAYQAWAESGQTGQPPQREAFIRQSELIKQNALKLYERVLAEYPRYERNAEVLFYLGYNEYEAGNKKKAVDHYLQLIKQFPQSPLVYDAHLQLGEHHFGANELIKAQRHYAEAVKAVDVPRIHNYALYKLAWCDYNYQEYAQGIKKLKAVIDKADTTTDKKSVQLRSEALKDLALFFSHVDEVDGAFAYFKAKGGEDIAIRYTESLGNLLGEQGKWTLQIDAFRLLLDKYPMNTRAPHLQSKIVEAYSQMNEKEKVRQEVERLVDLYRPGTPWYRHQEGQGQKGKAALEYAYDLTETSLRNLVTEYHRDAQKRKDVPTYRLARDIYAKYLDAFSETQTAYEMRYFYAEVLWALDEWRNAAEQYEIIAMTDVEDDAAKDKYRKEAAYNQILAWEKIIKNEKEKGDPTLKKRITEKKDKGTVDRTTTRVTINLDKDKSYEPEEIPEWEQQLSEAADLYFEVADRDDEDLPAIKFKAAYVYFDHNHFVEAAKRYFEIIETWPRHDLSKKSANLILDSLSLQKKWDELAYYAGEFKKNDKLVGNDTKFKSEVQRLLEASTYLAIQRDEKEARKIEVADEKEQELHGVAARFASFQNDFPDSKYADEATFSAVLIYNQADELDHAIRMAEIMRDEYSDQAEEELVQRNHLLLAEFYERIADFDTSASLYNEFYETYPKHEKAPDALYNAAIYYQGLGQTDTAIAKFTTYYTKHAKDPGEAADVYWRTCGLYEFQEKWEKAGKCYDQFRRKYASAPQAKVYESRYRYALMLEKQGKRRDAMKEYQWLVAEYPELSPEDQKADGAQLAGAHAKFELLEPEFQAFENIEINRLSKAVLQKKLGGANELACVSTDEAKCDREGKYLDVLTYGNGDYGICALTRMGQVFRDVADSLRNAPIPRRLTIDQQEIYKAELDALALGPEEKGLQAFERALDKAYELNIYNECTLTAQENLRELNPNQFPDLQKPGFRGAEVFILSDMKPADQVPDEVIEEVIQPAGSPPEQGGAQEQARKSP
jgi:tetratricopeptide (TPR) repeat protein